MDELIEKAKNLRKEIEKTEEYKNYHRYFLLYQKDETIQKLKKEIVRAGNENRLIDKGKLLNEYNNNPLVNNYLIAKEEFYSLLKTISDILK